MNRWLTMVFIGLSLAGEGRAADEPRFGPPRFHGIRGHGHHRSPPRLSRADRVMIELMTDDERAAAFAKIRQEWVMTLSPERKAQLDSRQAEADRIAAMSDAERERHFRTKRQHWLDSLTPEQRAEHERRRAEIEKVRQLTPPEQRAYFESRRKEWEAMTPDDRAKRFPPPPQR